MTNSPAANSPVTDGPAANGARPRRRPNVLVVLTDQQRWDTTGAGYCPLDLTPNLDRMARRGMFADCAITPNPLCAPARASLQTGLYPSATGVYRNRIGLPDDVPTLAGLMGAAGYTTGYIGKWHLSDQGHRAVPAGHRGGYAHWLGSNALEFTSDAYRTVVFDEDDQPVELPGYRADALTDAAIRFLADHRDEPQLLFVSLLEPHQQNEVDAQQAPDGYAERYAGRWVPPDVAAAGGPAHRYLGGYFGQVKRVDECLGRLLDALRSLEILDDTLVLFTSDHGSHFRTRSPDFKRTCHDASVRVPLVLQGPGADGGGCVGGVVSTVDVVPTILDVTGVAAPEGLHGSSLLRKDRSARHGTAVLSQVTEAEVGRVLRTSRWKYYVADPDADVQLTGASTHYLEVALYDLAADPYELDNLIRSDDHDPICVELRAELIRQIQLIEHVAVRIAPGERSRTARRREPTVRTSGLRGARFGHQSAPLRREGHGCAESDPADSSDHRPC